jgi:hypothetical protein
VKILTTPSDASVPVVGNVTDVVPVIVNVELYAPDVVKLPPSVTDLPPIFATVIVPPELSAASPFIGCQLPYPPVWPIRRLPAPGRLFEWSIKPFVRYKYPEPSVK